MMCDLDSEMTLIGSVFWRPGMFPEIAASVSASDFYHPSHRLLWDSLVSADKAGAMLDADTIVKHLEDRGDIGKLSGVGGKTYLAEVIDAGIVSANIRYHINRVVDKAKRRGMRRVFADLATGAGADTPDQEFFELTEKSLLETDLQRKSVPGLVNARQAFERLSNQVADSQRPDASPIITPTGLVKLDSRIGGLRNSSLTIVAARPGGGKSSFLGQVMASAALSGVGCLLFSLEMNAQEFAERIAAGYGLNTDNLRVGKFGLLDHVAMAKAASAHSDPVRLWIDESGEISITELRSRARRWRLNEGKHFKKIVIGVDYLQLVSSPEKVRELQIAAVSRAFKALAKELECPVIVAAQLNRALEARADKRPTPSDLRESGQIEQDADMILFLHRPVLFQPNTQNPTAAEIIIAKHRGGASGIVNVEFIADKTMFV